MTTARRFWELLEPVHAVNYFSPEAAEEGRRLGLVGFWMTYFAFRAAPLGPVGPAVVTASFTGFSPRRVARALPDAWSRTTPEQALDARRRAAVTVLDRCWTDVYADPDAAALAWRAAQHAGTAGRVLAAAEQALPQPETPTAVLWQAATTLREHRGDGHNAVLVALGISPVQAHLLKTAAEETHEEQLRTGRSWPDEAWTTALDGLVARGWLTTEGRFTEAGREAHDEVERLTDAAAEQPWTALTDDERTRLHDLLVPLSQAVRDAGAFPSPNPIGLG